ncbi:unnamed protein product [Amaranthus hypochondriacus]
MCCSYSQMHDPKNTSDYRLISCCNVIYKIISKVMANKLKPFLHELISINQSAFIPGRLITDNAVLAFEAFHAMKRRANGRSNTFALKLDMSKAYDRIDWSFLERVMLRMGFSDAWIRRILSCLSSVGCICGNVIPSRGLRQGDPISPYLFILCAEAFSSLLHRGVRQGNIHGVSICRGAPKLSHLFFADDNILFAKASFQECLEVANIISIYERASGQRANYDKSEISFSKGVPNDTRQMIIAKLGVNEVEKHAKYLGLPTIIGRSKKSIFTCLKERIWKKLQGWKEKCLSKAGKEVLLKAVIQSIPTYMMSLFRISDGVLDDIHAMMAKFWWGANGNERKIHWHGWPNLCMPKCQGGLGFRDLKIFNDALLAKQAWRLMRNSNSMVSQVFKARYYKNSDFLDSFRGFDPSFTWRSI